MQPENSESSTFPYHSKSYHHTMSPALAYATVLLRHFERDDSGKKEDGGDKGNHKEQKDDGKGCKNDALNQDQAIALGVCAALAGIILAIAVIYLIDRFKRHGLEGFRWPPKLPKPYKSPGMVRTSSTRPLSAPGGESTATVAAAGLRHRNAVDDLPQRQGNREYRHQVETLQSEIKNCVENFFPGLHILSDSQEAELERLAGPAVTQAPSIADLSDSRPYTRHCALRSLIARMIFHRIDPRAQPQTPLLPPALFAVHQSLTKKPVANRHRRSQSLGTSMIPRPLYFCPETISNHDDLIQVTKATEKSL